VLVIILALCIMLTFAACGSNSSSSSSSSSEKATSQVSSDKTAPTADSNSTTGDSAQKGASASGKDWAKSGKSLDFQNQSYTVNATMKTKGSVLPADDGKTYYLLDMTIKNNGSEEAAVSSLLLFELSDSDGNKYTLSIGGATELQSFKMSTLDGTIAPGKEMKGGLAFEIPENAKGLKLDIKAILGDEKGTIALE
ncbi:MAG: DUF4352 domain-containing protein, partial [Bacillota bacterium]|nr:DUF4352 domain-containing protein [Bacillota bacterium]